MDSSSGGGVQDLNRGCLIARFRPPRDEHSTFLAAVSRIARRLPLVLAVGAVIVLYPAPAVASAPTAIPTGPAYVTAITCPTETECVAFNEPGNVLAFDPLAPATQDLVNLGGQVDISGDSQAQIGDLACASATQCTAVGVVAPWTGGGQALTFNPTSPTTAPITATIGSGNVIACPSADQCTAVGMSPCPSNADACKDPGNQEVTFDPNAPADPQPVALPVGNQGAQAMSCPTVSQCTVAYETCPDSNASCTGGAVTFNPTAPDQVTRVTFSAQPHDISCPTVDECVIAGDAAAVVFNPTEPATHVTAIGPDRAFDSGRFRGLSYLACFASSECTAEGAYLVGTGVREHTISLLANFDPRAHRKLMLFRSNVPVTGDSLLAGLACASPHQCTAVDNGYEQTFDPRQRR